MPGSRTQSTSLHQAPYAPYRMERDPTRHSDHNARTAQAYGHSLLLLHPSFLWRPFRRHTIFASRTPSRLWTSHLLLGSGTLQWVAEAMLEAFVVLALESQPCSTKPYVKARIAFRVSPRRWFRLGRTLHHSCGQRWTWSLGRKSSFTSRHPNKAFTTPPALGTWRIFLHHDCVASTLCWLLLIHGFFFTLVRVVRR